MIQLVAALLVWVLVRGISALAGVKETPHDKRAKRHYTRRAVRRGLKF
jgi:hypothetical protein